MKKILFITAQEKDNVPSYFTRIVEDCRKFSRNEIYYAHINHLVFKVTNNTPSIYDLKNKRPLEDFDLVHVRKLRNVFDAEISTLAIYCKYRKVKFLNTNFINSTDNSKLKQAFMLGFNQINVPDIVYCADMSHLADLSSKLAFPCIMKAIDSSEGKHNFLLHNEDEVAERAKTFPEVSFLLQQFVPNNFDFRLIVLGDKVVSINRRERVDKNDHRNNIAHGARAFEVDKSEFNREILEVVGRINSLFNRRISGVDLAFGPDGKYYIFEANSAPGLAVDVDTFSEVRELAKFLDEEAEK